MASLSSAEFIANPYPYYRRLRHSQPVSKNGDGPWFLTRYEDVARVLRDRRFVRYTDRGFARLYGPRALEEPVLLMLRDWMLMADPPAHGRLRGLLAKGFGGWQMATLRPRIQDVADRLIDAALPHGHIEIISDYAYALTLTVICDLFGLPDEDRQPLRDHGRLNTAALSGLPLARSDIEQSNAQVVALEEYFRGLIERRRRAPTNDFTSALLGAEENGERLTDKELLANLIMMFVAGHETTTNLIGNGLLALHRHPNELRRLKEEPGLAANAIEELLRFEPPVHYVARAASEDLEIGGKLIKAGDWVFGSLAAANRDPAVFSAPDRLDIGRQNIRALSFGGGPHSCVGAQLGRLEAEIAITTLVRRLPPLQIPDIESPKWRPLAVIRGLQELHASW